jgi:UDP-N-acetylglucosamine diphosphorylase/glucosamine-1-phosphate N-acetyltransferase
MIVLIDTPSARSAMYPLALTKPIAGIRQGILTIKEWWQQKTGQTVYSLSVPYLQEDIPTSELFVCIDATVLPTNECLEAILALQNGELLEDTIGLIAYATNVLPVYNQLPLWAERSLTVETQKRLSHVSDLFKFNNSTIRQHYLLVTKNRISATPHISNTIIGGENLFIEAGVEMYGCTINALAGPVYIGKNAVVMEGTTIRGPVAICEGAVVKMGTRLYAGTTVGPFSTAGGEIKNSMISGHSNKAHDGYLGDSVIGEWCNLGAGTTNSNVKNTGGQVKVWNHQLRQLKEVGQKAGLVMGDYSRSAINSSFNTGTTIGVSCNVFDGTYPPKHLPSFSWGNYEQYGFEKACLDAANWKKMKGSEFTEKDRLILQAIRDGKE